MTTQKTPETLQKEALTVLVQWRSADKNATVKKGDHDAQKIEYKCRKNLRTAADNLTGVKHG